MQKESRLFEDGHSNQGFVVDNIPLEKRESNSLEEDTESSQEPTYCTIPENNGDTDTLASDSKSHYQPLNTTANGRSNAVYAKIINSDRPFPIILAQSDV